MNRNINRADLVKLSLNLSIREIAKAYSSETAFSRNSKLLANVLMRFIIGAEGGSLEKELRRAGIDVTRAAISQRRAQLPADAFHKVFDKFNEKYDAFNRERVDSETYLGLKLMAVDGTSVNIARNPDAPSFIRSQGYNQLHLNPLYDLCARTYFDAVIQPEPQKNEIGALLEMLKRREFTRRTLIIADRGYEGYNVLATLLNKENVDFLIRVRNSRSAMREVACLPMCELDCNIAFTLTTTQTNEDKRNRYIHVRKDHWDFQSPYPMKLRICRFLLNTGEFETIVTSLDRSFTLEDIKALYAMRWGIETSFRELKYYLGLINLHGRKNDDFSMQEIYAQLAMYNFVSRIAREAKVRQPKNGKYAYKVNFKMAADICREYFRGEITDGNNVLKEIGKHANAVRPGRADPRKLRPKGFVGFTYRVSA